jgi:hypothetical protein
MESRETTARELRESREKAESEMQELRESLRETSRIVDDLGYNFDRLAEQVYSNIREKFDVRGYSCTSTHTKICDNNGKIMAEFDVLLDYSDFVMAVGVTSQPTEEHVREHVQRMEVLWRYADEHGDGRKHIGAIAGAIINEQVRRYALKSGFYVIEQSGDTVKIDAPEGFKPKEW